MVVIVGREAPNFEAEAYHRGSIKQVSLKDHRGSWVVLFFYPADFTSV